MDKVCVTKYMKYCLICGKPNPEIHHCIEGTASRPLCDQDGLVIPLCSEHHTGNQSVHMNHEMNVMSHIIGQLAWEKHAVAGGISEDDAREAFRRRYGKSYL